VQGKFMGPLVQAFALSVVASLVVALTCNAGSCGLALALPRVTPRVGVALEAALRGICWHSIDALVIAQRCS
jgi:hypothetical protein